MNLLENYTQLNNSFKKKLVFHLGVNAGFFSEYNNMILAMLYCIENKIQFSLYSGDANFAYNQGWTDYFLPFCEEDKNPFHAKYNFRYDSILKRLRPQVWLYWLFNRNTYLTFELLNVCRNRQLERKNYYIPELGINGDLQHACQVLINLTWRYNKETECTINSLISSLHIPEEYVGLHVRSGDKLIETELINVSKYIEEVQLHSKTQNAFVLTDNYLIVEELQRQLKDWNIHTLCQEEERGYFHADFQQRGKDVIKEAHQKLFASVDILSRSTAFVGTFSSNPGMYMGMRMDKEQSFSVDIKDWQIW